MPILFPIIARFFAYISAGACADMPAAVTAYRAELFHQAHAATADPAMVQLIRIAGFAIMALGIIVIIARWWRNR